MAVGLEKPPLFRRMDVTAMELKKSLTDGGRGQKKLG